MGIIGVRVVALGTLMSHRCGFATTKLLSETARTRDAIDNGTVAGDNDTLWLTASAYQRDLVSARRGDKLVFTTEAIENDTASPDSPPRAGSSPIT